MGIEVSRTAGREIENERKKTSPSVGIGLPESAAAAMVEDWCRRSMARRRPACPAGRSRLGRIDGENGITSRWGKVVKKPRRRRSA